jgi:hypothetical protein
MKLIEIITLRCPSKINGQFIDDLLKGVDESDAAADRPRHLVEIKIYHHSVVETDLSIQIHWESEKESQGKSPLGLRLSSALKPLGLLNHSVWVETAALEFPYGNARSGTSYHRIGRPLRKLEKSLRKKERKMKGPKSLPRHPVPWVNSQEEAKKNDF